MNTKDTSTIDEAHPREPSWRCVNEEVGDQLFAYLASELTDENAQVFESHLRECVKCQADKTRLEVVFRVIRANPKKFFPNSKRKKGD